MSTKYHGIETHNGWIRRNCKCPYCSRGSMPVHETLLKLPDNEIDKIVEKIKKE